MPRSRSRASRAVTDRTAREGEQGSGVRRGLALPRVVSAVLGCAVGIQALVLGTRLSSSDSLASPDASTLPARPPVQAPSIEALAGLFGTSPGSAARPPDSPATTHSFVLAGSIALTDPRTGFAMIGGSADGVRLVRGGGEIPGGGVLLEVYPYRVLVEIGGVTRTVLLPRSGMTGEFVPPVYFQAARPAGPVEGRASWKRRMVGRTIRPTVQVAADGTSDIRIFMGSNREAFTALGFKQGDVVTHVDGVALRGDLKAASKALAAVGANGDSTLTILRDGAVIALEIPRKKFERWIPVAPPDPDDDP